MDVSLKLCRKVGSFRRLKPNLKRVNSFTLLDVFIEIIFLSCSLRFHHASAQYGKKDDSKVLVLAGKVFILFQLKIE